MFRTCLYFLAISCLLGITNCQKKNSLTATIHKPDAISFNSKEVDGEDGQPSFAIELELKEAGLWTEKMDLIAYVKNPQTGEFDKEVFRKSTAFCKITEGKPLFDMKGALSWLNCEREMKNIKTSGIRPKLVDGIAEKGEMVKVLAILYSKNEPAITWELFIKA